VNRAAVVAELPPAVREWLDDLDASEETWRHLAGDLAIRVGRRVRVSGGDGAWNKTIYARLAADASPAVRAVVVALPHGPHERPWTARLSAERLTQHFGIANAEALRHQLTAGLEKNLVG